jgi:hypothetical protein
MIASFAEKGQSLGQWRRILVQSWQLLLRANSFQHLLYPDMKNAEVTPEQVGR